MGLHKITLYKWFIKQSRMSLAEIGMNF